MGRPGVGCGAVAALSAALLSVVAPASARAAGECGLPDAQPVWIDYGEGSLKPDVRAVFTKPGVVLASSGLALPATYRKAGVATTYFELHLPKLVGEPADPADGATILGEADDLYAQAVQSTACPTPWIALNELAGSNLAMPWSPSNAAYRANVLALVQRLAERGAHPALLVHGNPTVAGDTALWWRTVSESAQIVYEAYYDASKMYPLGPVLANRRMRLGMRFTVALFESAGVPRNRLGFMLGFHSALTPGVAGRQGLEPTEAWLRVVKWEALAARQVALDERIPTIWSWGWGTFGPDSVDADKAAAACAYLWARDVKLCDAPSVGGPGFSTSLVEGQIVEPAGATCTFAGGHVWTKAVDRLARVTHDRHTALTAEFARAALYTAAPVTERDIAAAERAAVRRAFHGRRPAYLRALARRGADETVALGVIGDELRRRAIARKLQGTGTTTFDWIADRESRAVDTAICLRDELPGTGQPLSLGNARDVGTVPLAARLPFLFADRTPPAAPPAPTAVATVSGVTLTWPSGDEPDLAGYEIFRALPGAPGKPVGRLLGQATFFDAGAPAGTAYTVRAVDTSGNRSAFSAPAALH